MEDEITPRHKKCEAEKLPLLDSSPHLFKKDRDFSLGSTINEMREGKLWGQLTNTTSVLNNGKLAVQLWKASQNLFPAQETAMTVHH